ncbi:30S ribosomal protein S21 [Thermodesulfovibrio hydrogeniphilus]
MPSVNVKNMDSFEAALKMFKKQVEREGILSEIKKREHYEKPSVKRKKKVLAAKKKLAKKLKQMAK